MPDEFELAQQRHDVWERSPESVLVRLDLAPWVDDPTLAQIIVETVLRLPDEVLEFVCAQCTFVWFGRNTLAHTAPARYFSRPWVIHLSPQLSLLEAHTAVAHEIAHAWLGHTELMPLYEAAAASLAQSWGFTGPGADVEETKRIYGI
jgi:hypothetical protein